MRKVILCVFFMSLLVKGSSISDGNGTGVFVSLPGSCADNEVFTSDGTGGEAQCSTALVDDNGDVTVGGNTTGDSNLGTISSVSLGAYYVGSVDIDFLGAFASTQTETILYTKIGNLVHLSVPTSNDTCDTATTINNVGDLLPAGLQPKNSFRSQILVFDDGGSLQSGQIFMESDGKITVFPLVSGGSFTAANTCGWDRYFEISYYAD